MLYVGAFVCTQPDCSGDEGTILPAPPSTPWKTISFTGLLPSSFCRITSATVIDCGQNPDFSATGSVIEFGFARSNTHTAAASVTRVTGIDNWQWSLNPTAAVACTTSWASPVSGNWDDAAAWSSGVPISTSNVCITVAGADTVTLAGSRSVNSVDIGPSAGTLLVQGNSTFGTAALTAATGIINAGTITLDSVSGGFISNLTVTTGVLEHTAGGVINIEPGTGGSRTINADITNTGTVDLNVTTSFNKSSGVINNDAGAIDIAAGQTMDILGAGFTFNQNGGTLAIDGLFQASSDTFNFNGGTITGTPLLRASTLNLGIGSTSPAAFSMRGSSALTGDIKAAQTVAVLGDNISGTATLTAASGFTNAGTISLDSITGGFNSNLTVTSGVLANTGDINLEPGTGGARTVNANIDNTGTVDLNVTTSFNKSTGVINNDAGIIDIASGQTMDILGSSFTFNQNGGTLATNAFQMTSDTFNFNGGTITGTPLLRVSTLNLGAGSTSPASFSMRGSSALSGDIKAGQTVTVLGDSISGTATLTAAAEASSTPSRERAAAGPSTPTSTIPAPWTVRRDAGTGQPDPTVAWLAQLERGGNFNC